MYSKERCARRQRPRRALSALCAAAALTLPAAGCVSMPTGGPVLPYATSPSGNGQAQPNLQFVPQPPIANAPPSEIVSGFLAASASFVGQQQVAREYLTPDASRAWRPGWSATVFRDGPNIDKVTTSASATPAAGNKLSGTASPSPAGKGPAANSGDANIRVTITVGGSVEAQLNSSGAYAVASAQPKGRTASGGSPTPTTTRCC